MRFGTTETGGYVDRLLRPNSRADCRPVRPRLNRSLEPASTFHLDEDYAQELKTRFEFDLWKDRNRAGASVFCWRFHVTGGESPGWRMERLRRYELEEPRSWLHTVWLPSDGNDPTIVIVQIQERTSRFSAREGLIQELADFELPIISRDDDLETGDVLFCDRKKTILLFARANLLFSIRNGARVERRLEALARTWDKWVVGDRARAARLPTTTAVARHARLDSSGRLRVDLPERDPLGRSVWYRLKSETGEFSSAGGALFYAPGPFDLHSISVDSLSGASVVGAWELVFTVI